MDGVHFAWDKCHAPSVPAYKRKENYPTVVYNFVTCDHARRVMPPHGPFPGARSDKNIARTDLAVLAVRYDSVYLWFKIGNWRLFTTCASKMDRLLSLGPLYFAIQELLASWARVSSTKYTYRHTYLQCVSTFLGS
jgi:hypothetical protein